MFSLTLDANSKNEAPSHDSAHSGVKVVFDAEFTFGVDEDRELIFYLAAPPTPEAARRFAELVGANPGWSDARTAQAVKGAGARFGPDDKKEFLDFLPLRDLKPYVGELKVESAQFTAQRFAARIGKIDPAEYPVCVWKVEATSRLPSGTEKHYVLAFEAFGGKLVNLFWPGH